MGWKIDWRKLRRHLEETYAVDKAYYFIGYVDAYQGLYNALRSYGYEMEFKPTYVRDGGLKGNIDAELVLLAMTRYRVYKQAVIVTSDGDFACLVAYLKAKKKLRDVVACRHGVSHLLEQAAGTQISYIEELRGKLEYR